MTNVLIVNGQPNPHGPSSTGRILAELAKRLPEAQIRAVADTVTEDKTYVAAEQEALKKADVIVWQFPIYWYSAPAKMKQWIDDVLAYGFAYGSEGDALKGKKLLVSVTTGESKDEYTPKGAEHFYLKDFLVQFEQAALFCSMTWLEPVASYAMMFIPGVTSDAEKARIDNRICEHADEVVSRIRDAA